MHSLLGYYMHHFIRLRGNFVSTAQHGVEHHTALLTSRLCVIRLGMHVMSHDLLYKCDHRLGSLVFTQY